MSSYAIAGGAGFLGAAIAARVGQAGHQVRILDDFSAPAAQRRAQELRRIPAVTLIEGDVRDADACRRLVADSEFVLHAAAPAAGAGERECAEVILGGTVSLLTACREAATVRRFVFASSSAVYGEGPALMRHEASLPDPVTPAACALLSAEHFCRAAFRRDGLQTVCLRYFEIYGPEMDGSQDSPLTELLRAAVTGETATLTGDNGQAYDYLYIDDAVEAFLRAASAQRGIGGKVFNIGSGRALMSQHLREKLEKLLQRPLSVTQSPGRLIEVRLGRADTAAAAGLLQFTASVTAEEGLARTMDWAEKSWRRERILKAA